MTVFLGKEMGPECLSKLAQSNTTNKEVPPGSEPGSLTLKLKTTTDHPTTSRSSFVTVLCL